MAPIACMGAVIPPMAPDEGDEEYDDADDGVGWGEGKIGEGAKDISSGLEKTMSCSA